MVIRCKYGALITAHASGRLCRRIRCIRHRRLRQRQRQRQPRRCGVFGNSRLLPRSFGALIRSLRIANPPFPKPSKLSPVPSRAALRRPAPRSVAVETAIAFASWQHSFVSLVSSCLTVESSLSRTRGVPRGNRPSPFSDLLLNSTVSLLRS